MTTLRNTYSVLIKIDPEAAFAYVSDLTRHPEWSGGRLSIQAVSAGAIGVGSQYQSKGDVAGQKDRPNQLRVTEYQPPSRFAFVANDPDFGDVVHEFKFTPQPGGTLVERTVTTILPPVNALMHTLFIHPLIGRPMMDKAFKSLKVRLEIKP